MTRDVSLTPLARLEVEDAFGWYEARSQGLGLKFRAELDRQIQRISENGGQFPIVHSIVRAARLRRFPYSLYFQESTNRAIVVIACFHASRDPRQLESRS